MPHCDEVLLLLRRHVNTQSDQYIPGTRMDDCIIIHAMLIQFGSKGFSDYTGKCAPHPTAIDCCFVGGLAFGPARARGGSNRLIVRVAAAAAAAPCMCT
jgi:hypothetical protein